MNLNFAAAIQALGANAAFRIMNAARPAADYLLNTFLPERNKPTYQAKSGTMTVRTTMAGLVGTDSPYPPSGIVDGSDFNEQVAKIANHVGLSEMAQRELQALLQALQGNAEIAANTVRDTALNFLDKLVTQAHLDAMEYLRGMALSTGALSWTYNKITLSVDYGVPAGNIFPQRTGTAGYGGSASVFWADYRAGRSKLKGQVRAVLAHPDTIDMIVSNDVNKVRVIAQDNVTGTYTIQKFVGSTEQLSSDQRDKVTLVAYGKEGEIIDVANPGRPQAALHQAGAHPDDRGSDPAGLLGRHGRDVEPEQRAADRLHAHRPDGRRQRPAGSLGGPARAGRLAVAARGPWRDERAPGDRGAGKARRPQHGLRFLTALAARPSTPGRTPAPSGSARWRTPMA
jgi:hypothetical protein